MLAAGCAAAGPSGSPAGEQVAALSGPRDSFAGARASSRRVGPGARFRPPPRGVLASKRTMVDGMRCEAATRVLSAAHVEVFAEDHVVVVPAGIGVGAPLRRAGAYVRGGSCVYPLRTLEPTGLVLLGPGATRTLGDFFALWGQPLGDRVLAGFRAPRGARVAVYLNGVAWRADPAAAPLFPHAQLTVEVGPHVPPHVRYLFPAVSIVR